MSNEYKELDVNDYDVIFSCIHKRYIDYCNEWIKTVKNKFNLKKLEIRNIYYLENNLKDKLDKDFEAYLWKFRDGLAMLYLIILSDIERSFSESKKPKIIGRQKTEESILDKIHRKMIFEDGSFSINKYLNDILGFRIIDHNYEKNKDNIRELLERYREDGCKVTHKPRSNKGYEAYHIYFKESNYTFPVEIQIWDSKNEQNNLSMHNVYKQDYVEKIINDYDRF